MDTVELHPVFLVYAFRYGLGRRTYVVADIAETLIANQDKLRPEWRALIAEEIDIAIQRDQAGMDIDIKKWQEVKEAMQRG